MLGNFRAKATAKFPVPQPASKAVVKLFVGRSATVRQKYKCLIYVPIWTLWNGMFLNSVFPNNLSLSIVLAATPVIFPPPFSQSPDLRDKDNSSKQDYHHCRGNLYPQDYRIPLNEVNRPIHRDNNHVN